MKCTTSLFATWVILGLLISQADAGFPFGSRSSGRSGSPSHAKASRHVGQPHAPFRTLKTFNRLPQVSPWQASVARPVSGSHSSAGGAQPTGIHRQQLVTHRTQTKFTPFHNSHSAGSNQAHGTAKDDHRRRALPIVLNVLHLAAHRHGASHGYFSHAAGGGFTPVCPPASQVPPPAFADTTTGSAGIAVAPVEQPEAAPKQNAERGEDLSALPQVTMGAELSLSGEAFGKTPGQAWLRIGPVLLKATVNEWTEKEVRMTLPDVPLITSTKATIAIQDSEHRVVDAIDVHLLPRPKTPAAK